MASVIQEVQSDDAFVSGTSLASPAFAANASLGSVIEAWLTVTSNATMPTTLTDSAAQTYNLKTSDFDAGGNQKMAVYVLANNASATKLIVTATFGASLAGKGLLIKEIGGVIAAAYDISVVSNTVTGPGSGANAITSTAVTPTGTLPYFCSSMAMECFIGNGSGLTGGTGWTTGIKAWFYGTGNNLAQSANKPLPTAVSTQALFTDATTGASGSYLVGIAIYDVATSAGVAAITEGHDTVAGVGGDKVAGVAGITEGHDTPAGVGTVKVAGVSAITEGHDTVAGVGGDTVAGVAAITEGADTVAGVGTASTAAAGVAAITEGSDTVAGVGGDAVAGVAGITEGADTVAGVGVASTATSGVATITEVHDTPAGVGGVSVFGVAAITEAHDAVAASGAVAVAGIAAILEGSDAVAAAGTVKVAGAAAIVETSDTANASGTYGVFGIAGVTETHDTVMASGQALNGSGLAAITEGADIVNASGVILQPVVYATIEYREGSFAYAPPWYTDPPGGPPYPTLDAGELSPVAGTLIGQSGIAAGRFGWFNPLTGIVNNQRSSAADQIGVTLPKRANWEACYFSQGSRWLRSGYQMEIMPVGAFWLRFAGGAFAGDQVYASLVDGSAISGDNVTQPIELTKFFVTRGCSPNGLAQVSTWARFV